MAVTSYTFIGGFMAVSRTDVFQAMVMVVSFIVLPLTLISSTAEPFSGVGQSPGFLNPFTDADGNTITAVFILFPVLRAWARGNSSRETSLPLARLKLTTSSNRSGARLVRAPGFEC